MRMFGTNGIRGVTNEDLDCELALRVGRSIGKVLGHKIAVAMDTRLSSHMVKYALCSGLMSVGTEVLDLGMVPTPALQHYVRVHPEITGGVMITASHNPPEYNGIKCISADGTECSRDEEKSIEDTYDTDVPCVGWNSVGTVRTVTGAAEDYVDSIVSKVDADSIRAANLTACVDCANGASVETTPLLLRKLGVRAITINGNPQGDFPGHPSEPVEENLTELKRMVIDTSADLGIAHDGDADRCVFITDRGRYLSGDRALAILADSMVRRAENGEIVVTVATSSVVRDVTERAGGRIVYTAVGSPIVARRMLSDGGIFGGEENGGLIFADHQYCRDGAMGAARMLEILSSGKRLSELEEDLPEYTTLKRTVSCPDEIKHGVLERVKSAHSSERVNDTDGLRIDYKDGWVLIRPSGTEPKFRIYSESTDWETAANRSDGFMSEIGEIIKELTGVR